MILNLLRKAKASFYENIESKKQLLPSNRPVISFTFDDAPLTCMRKGVELLERFEFKSTFYLCGKMAQLERKGPGRHFVNVQEAISLRSKGHQIACHTYNHDWLGAIPAQSYAEDCALNRAFWAQHLGEALVDFSYPLGRVSLAGKRLLKDHYQSLRGIRSGINRNNVDMAYLRSVSISNGTFNPQKIEHLIQDCTMNGGWLIFFAHGVDELHPESFDTNSKDFKWVIDATKDSGAPVMTVEGARKYLLSS